MRLRGGKTTLVTSGVKVDLKRTLVPVPVMKTTIKTVITATIVKFIRGATLGPCCRTGTSHGTCTHRSTTVGQVGRTVIVTLRTRGRHLRRLRGLRLREQRRAFRLNVRSVLRTSLSYGMRRLASKLRAVLSCFKRRYCFGGHRRFSRFFSGPLEGPFILWARKG